MKNINNQWISWAILIALVLTWGSSFILIKKALIYFNGLEVGLLRVAIAFIALSPVAFKRLRKIQLRKGVYLFLSGLIGSFFPAILFAVAQTGINSSLAGALNALTPLFTLLSGVFFFKQRTRWYNVTGVLIGLVGALGLINVSGSNGFSFNIAYASLVILATVFYAFNVNFIKNYLKDIDSLTITAFTFFFIGIPTLLYLLFFSEIPNKLIQEPSNLMGIMWVSILAVIGTGLALIAFNKLIKDTSALFASSVTYLIPLVALVWGIIDGESFHLIDLLWFALILGGVLLVNARPGGSRNLSNRIFFNEKQKF